MTGKDACVRGSKLRWRNLRPASSADQGPWVENKAQICPRHTASFLTSRPEANPEQSIVVRVKNQTGK